MQITRVNMPESKYAVKCPFVMNPTRIVVHNTANDASAMSEISYMIGNDRECSFHYAVDDYRAVQGVDEHRNAWHAGDGNGKGNREGIAIEICYSKSGGERFNKAEDNAAELIVSILKRYGWGIDKVTKHQDYSGKYCPHRTLDMGWERFINKIKSRLNGTTSQPTPSQSTGKKINVKYQVYAGGQWYSDVINLTDYAGAYGLPISGFRGNTVGKEAEVGNLIYRVHTLNGKWLGEIKDRQKDKTGDNFAGILGHSIDGIVIKSTVGTARYRVHTKNGKWLGWITQYNINDSIKGMAGIYGREIDAIQVEIV